MKRLSLGVLLLGVAACSDGPAAPAPPSFTSVLDVGQSSTASGGATAALTIEATGGPGEYLLVVSNLSEAGGAGLGVEIGATGVGGGAFSSAPAGTANSLSMTPRGAAPDSEFHLRLRERGIAELGGRMRRGIDQEEARLHSLAGQLTSMPAVGDLLRLNTTPRCDTIPTIRTGRVAAISQQAIIVADTANPAGGFSDAVYDSIAMHFDAAIHPVVVANFGEPTDIDGNGRVVVFFTRAVNELTGENADSYTGGFFWAGDLFPRESTSRAVGCANSNFGEIFYMLVPDPQGEVNGNKRETDFVRRVTPGVLAHEYQHLVNAARRLYVNQAPGFEEVWLNEGLSHIAEELMFYSESGLAPRRNLDAEAVRATPQALEAFNRYGISNFLRLKSYLERPRENSPLGRDALATRGAAWQFLRYAADRHPGSERALWLNLAGSTRSGLSNLRTGLGTDPLPWIHDWSVALFTDDFVGGLAPRHQQPSWHYRSIFAALPPKEPFPLQVEPLSTTPVSFTVRGGSSSHLVFHVAAGGQATIRISSGGAPPPATLTASIVRIR
jgi:hypothetical protein